MGYQVDTAVLDNTGTSTEGVPRVGSAALGVTALGQVLSPGRRAQAVAVNQPGIHLHF